MALVLTPIVYFSVLAMVVRYRRFREKHGKFHLPLLPGAAGKEVSSGDGENTPS